MSFSTRLIPTTVSSISSTPSPIIALSLSPTGANCGQPVVTTVVFMIHSTPTSSSTACASSTTPELRAICALPLRHRSPSITPARNSSRFVACMKSTFKETFLSGKRTRVRLPEPSWYLILHNSYVISTVESERGTPRNTVSEHDLSLHASTSMLTDR